MQDSNQGLPVAWTVKPKNLTSIMFGNNQAQPEAAAIEVAKPAAKPSRIHTPTLVKPATQGTISINVRPDELADLIVAINRATGQGQPQVKLHQDPIALGLVGLGLLCITGIASYTIATMSAQSPVLIQQKELDRLERMSAVSAANQRKLAEKAAEQRSVCILSLGCK